MNAYDRPNVGLGTTVTTELIEIAKKEGLESLKPSVCASKKKDLQAYQKCGFKEVAG